MMWPQINWFVISIVSIAVALLVLTGWLWWLNRRAQKIDALLEITAADKRRLDRIEAALKPHERPEPPKTAKVAIARYRAKRTVAKARTIKKTKR